jgi:hypothetical protein
MKSQIMTFSADEETRALLWHHKQVYGSNYSALIRKALAEYKKNHPSQFCAQGIILEEAPYNVG